MPDEQDATPIGAGSNDVDDVAKLPETECNLADNDGDGLVDDGLAWRAGGWHVLLDQPGTSEVEALRLDDGTVAFAALAKRALSGTAAVWIGTVDSSGHAAATVTRALDWTRIDGWGIAFDREGEQLLLGYVVQPTGELHIDRYEVADEVTQVDGTRLVSLPYPAIRLFDFGCTSHGPVVLVGHEDGYARAEWVDRLGEADDWNHKLVKIRPDVAKLAIGDSVGWAAGGYADTHQAAVMAGVLALDGSSEVVTARNIHPAGGGSYLTMQGAGTAATWLGPRMWLTYTDDTKANRMWSVRVARFDPASPPSARVDIANTTGSLADPAYGHSVAEAQGNILATSVTSDRIMVHRLGPNLEHVVPTDMATIIDDSHEHAIVGGSEAPLLFRVRSSTRELDVGALECP